MLFEIFLFFVSGSPTKKVSEVGEISSMEEKDLIEVKRSLFFDNTGVVPFRSNEKRALRIKKLIFDKEEFFVLDTALNRGVCIYYRKEELIKQVGVVSRKNHYSKRHCKMS